MKRLIALVLALLLCGSAALAEFDTASLRDMENTTTFTHPGTVNTVTRLLNQPYLAQVDAPGEGELSVFVDFITLPDYEVTLLRLLTGTVTYAPLAANEMRITAGGKRYTFTVNYEQSEYDGIYMEDYAVCLTDAADESAFTVVHAFKDICCIASLREKFAQRAFVFLQDRICLTGTAEKRVCNQCCSGDQQDTGDQDPTDPLFSCFHRYLPPERSLPQQFAHSRLYYARAESWTTFFA